MISKKILSPLLIAAALSACATTDGGYLYTSNGDYQAPSRRPVPNAANPLGEYSKVNPLLPSPG